MLERYDDFDGSITVLCADCEVEVVVAWPTGNDFGITTFGADYAGKHYEGSKADIEGLIKRAFCAECKAEEA